MAEARSLSLRKCGFDFHLGDQIEFKLKGMIFISYKWENFSQDELKRIVEESKSIVEIARKIGYSDKSSNSYKCIYAMIEYYNFNTSHLLGQGWNKSKYDYSRLQNGVAVKSPVLKRILIHLRGHKCEMCGMSLWNDFPIPLEVHHEDGNTLNNELNNIHLLCPNCHAVTYNWRKPNTDIVPDDKFIEALHNSKNIRQALLSLGLVAKGGNYKRAKKLLAENPK